MAGCKIGKECLFPVCHQGDSCTKETKVATAPYLGTVGYHRILTVAVKLYADLAVVYLDYNILIYKSYNIDLTSLFKIKNYTGSKDNLVETEKPCTKILFVLLKKV